MTVELQSQHSSTIPVVDAPAETTTVASRPAQWESLKCSLAGALALLASCVGRARHIELIQAHALLNHALNRCYQSQPHGRATPALVAELYGARALVNQVADVDEELSTRLVHVSTLAGQAGSTAAALQVNT